MILRVRQHGQIRKFNFIIKLLVKFIIKNHFSNVIFVKGHLFKNLLLSILDIVKVIFCKKLGKIRYLLLRKKKFIKSIYKFKRIKKLNKLRIYKKLRNQKC